MKANRKGQKVNNKGKMSIGAKKKLVALVVFVVVTMVVVPTAAAMRMQPDEPLIQVQQHQQAETQEPAQSTLARVEGEAQVSHREETVYATLNMDGSVRMIQAVVRLQVDSAGDFHEQGGYISVQNLTDTREPELTEDGVLWNFNEPVQDFYFQGTLKSGELPFELTFDYTLDGEPIDDPTGVSGDLEVHIGIRPNDSAADYFKENYMMQLQLPLPVANAQDIEAPGATGALVGGTRTLAFVALPGQTNTFDIKLKAVDFTSGGFTASLLPYDVSSMVDLSEADTGLSDMDSGLSDLVEGTKDLQEGTDDMASGLSKLSDGADKLSNGAAQYASGVSDYVGGVQKAAEGSSGIKSGLKDVKDGFDDLNAAGEAVKSALSGASGGVDVSGDMQQLSGLIAGSQTLSDAEKQQMLGLLQSIGDDLASAQKQSGEAPQKIAEYVDGVKALSSGFEELKSGIESYTSGVDALAENGSDIADGGQQLKKSSAQLASGLSEVAEQAGAVPDAIGKIAEGQEEMQVGVSEFKQQLGEVTGTGSETALVSFINGGAVDSVQFVMQAPEIITAEDSASGDQTVAEEQNLWEKIKNLFE